MAVLSVQDVGHWFGERQLMTGVTFSVEERSRIGLVGVNGCGKTTLFRLITGELNPDEGSITKGRFTKIGYMEQMTLSAEKSVYDETMTVFEPLIRLEDELNEVNRLVEESGGDIELIERQHRLTERYTNGGGLTCRARARSALIGLGFSEDQLSQDVNTLSGGQRSKVQLCKLLLSEADMLLLDEPTNHLDIDSTKWLEDFLLSYPGAFIVISHDRYFLDRVTNMTAELENRRLTLYKGGYTAYLSAKAEKRESDMRHNQNTEREIKRIEGVVEQQKRWNQERNYVTIASKQKQIERLKKELVTVEKLPDKLRFSFDVSQPVTSDILKTDRLALSYGEKRIFSELCMTVHKGERAFLLGENGCGKSSLLKVLAGKQPGDLGSFTYGPGVDEGYFDQTLSSLHAEKDALNEIWDVYPRMTETQVRSALAVFLFKGEDVFRQVGKLSGGERARLAILKLMLSKANFLLLDEPTNHLDIASREALEQALLDYDGTLFIVSHDRYFINKLATCVYYMQDGSITRYDGNYDYFEANRVPCEQQPSAAKQPGAGGEEYRRRKERESEARKLKTRIARTEKLLSELAESIAQLENELAQPETASDYEKLMELTERLRQLNEEETEQYELLEKLYDESERQST